MPQQTALELVISQLKEEIRKSAHNQLGTNRTGDYRIGLLKAIDFCEQAKELEKEQHRKTYHQGLNSNFQDFEQYYNETYKTKKP